MGSRSPTGGALLRGMTSGISHMPLSTVPVGSNVRISPHVVKQHSDWPAAETVKHHSKFFQWKIPLQRCLSSKFCDHFFIIIVTVMWREFCVELVWLLCVENGWDTGSWMVGCCYNAKWYVSAWLYLDYWLNGECCMYCFASFVVFLAIVTNWCVLIMVALCNRADHYIFALWLLSFYLFLFPRLISAPGYWMSTILPHMVWP